MRKNLLKVSHIFTSICYIHILLSFTKHYDVNLIPGHFPNQTFPQWTAPRWIIPRNTTTPRIIPRPSMTDKKQKRMFYNYHYVGLLPVGLSR